MTNVKIGIFKGNCRRMKATEKGLKRVINAAGFSWQGFKATYKHEEAFRQEFILAVLLTPLGYFLSETKLEFIALIGVLFLVLIVEVLNSAIESVVDRVGEEYHELSGRAKDQGSLAVLLSIIFAVLVWLVVLWP